MRNLLRCRRGTVAFATVIALVPLIGVIALGGEAASWYVTKQHAQNAADAAAYSAGLGLACSTAGGNSCSDAHDYVYRGKEFAAQNGFCNARDTGYPGSTCSTSLPKGVAQSVAITPTTWNGNSAVQATVTQTQPTYLATVLGIKSVTPGATAIAQVSQSAPQCVLALGGPITFQDNGIGVKAPNCGLASNFPGPGASIDFKNVSPSNVSIGPSVAVGGCTGTPALCQQVTPYSPPVTDPYTALDAALSKLTLPACAASKDGSPVAYTAKTLCANNNYSLAGSSNYTLSGTYFFSGTSFTMKGNSSGLTVDTTTGATIILLDGVTTGKSNHINMSLQAPDTTPTALPPSLQSYGALIGATAIYDTETDAQKLTGKTNITVTNGIMYYPNESLTFSGNSTINVNGCSELIAKQITFAGSVNFTQKGCPSTAIPTSQLVRLVR